jgi:hypothetical protein
MKKFDPDQHQTDVEEDKNERGAQQVFEHHSMMPPARI